MSVTVALIEYSTNRNEKATSSGLLFSEKFVLIPGCALYPLLKDHNSNEWMYKHSPGLFYNVFQQDTPKFTVTTKREVVSSRQAQVIAGFVCQNVFRSCKTCLKDWAINDYPKELLSVFFILELDCPTNQSLLQESLAKLLDVSHQITPSIGQEIFIESVPFGSKPFLNTYSRGILSNLVGENSCFILTDCSSTPGSEGSPVFYTNQSERVALAIVISSANWWKGEWVGLTLAANLESLLVPIVKRNELRNRYLPLKTKLIGAINKCLVRVTNKSVWGTAILINKQKGIFLTNSHVIVSNEAILQWLSHQIKATLVYKTPDDSVYDLAVLKCNPYQVRELDDAPISLIQAKIGEDVFGAGFPLFSYDTNQRITLTKGSISKVTEGILHTTCSVLPGSSGGAIFRQNGEIVGVIVSNVKIHETGVVYPRVNMAIPIMAIYSIVEDFLSTGDVESLHRLHSKDSNTIREWNNLCSKL